jgi:hypothetical protein
MLQGVEAQPAVARQEALRGTEDQREYDRDRLIDPPPPRLRMRTTAWPQK